MDASKKTTIWIGIIFIAWLLNVFDNAIITYLRRIPFLGKYIGESFPFLYLYEMLIGSFLYFKRNTIVRFFKKWRMIAFLLLAFFTCFHYKYSFTGIFFNSHPMHSPIITLIVCPLTIFLGYAMGCIHLKYEISYGLFMFHIIVIQILLLAKVKGYLGIALTLLITTIIALLTCIYVEKPCYRLRKIQFTRKC